MNADKQSELIDRVKGLLMAKLKAASPCGRMGWALCAELQGEGEPVNEKIVQGCLFEMRAEKLAACSGAEGIDGQWTLAETGTGITEKVRGWTVTDFAVAPLVGGIFNEARVADAVPENYGLCESLTNKVKGWTPEQKKKLAFELEKWARELRDNAERLAFKRIYN